MARFPPRNPRRGLLRRCVVRLRRRPTGDRRVSFSAQPGETSRSSARRVPASRPSRACSAVLRQTAAASRSMAWPIQKYQLRACASEIAIVLQDAMSPRERSPTTWATAGSTRATPRSRTPPARRTRTTSSSISTRATTPSSAKGGEAHDGRAPAAQHRARVSKECADPDPRRANRGARYDCRDPGGRLDRGCGKDGRRSSSRIGCRPSATRIASSSWTTDGSSRRARTTSCSRAASSIASSRSQLVDPVATQALVNRSCLSDERDGATQRPVAHTCRLAPCPARIARSAITWTTSSRSGAAPSHAAE